MAETLIRQLFTKRFIKDILLIVIFGGMLYFLVHNPITKPKLPQVEGVWTIQLVQHPIVLGIAGHNYLILRDNKNNIHKELHGLATNNETGEWKYRGNNKKDLLKVWEFDDTRYLTAQKDYTGVILFTGTESETRTTWEKGYPCKDMINEKNIPYPPYGVKVKGETENSNSVAYTLLRCMNLPSRYLGLFIPGWGNDLLNEIK